jgi:AcrR family transcriptional regulator
MPSRLRAVSPYLPLTLFVRRLVSNISQAKSVMESRRGTLGTQAQRRAAAQAKIIDAAIALIGEQGLSAFTVSDVGKRAGVSRALAGHHFKTSKALIQAAAASLLQDDDAGSGERGLAPMLGWIEAQLGRAVARDPRLLATLQVAVGPGAAAVKASREAYWRREAERLKQHLTAAKTLHQVSPDLDPVMTAPAVLGMLHGEQLRILATGQPPALLEVLKRALAPSPRRNAIRKNAPAQDAPDLFGPAGR